MDFCSELIHVIAGCAVLPQQEAKRAVENEGSTPKRPRRSDTPPVKDSPRKSSCLQGTPVKVHKPMESPGKGHGGLGSPRKSIRLLTTPVKAKGPMGSPREGDGGLGSSSGKKLRGESLRIRDGPVKASPLKGKKVDSLLMQAHDAKPQVASPPRSQITVLFAEHELRGPVT